MYPPPPISHWLKAVPGVYTFPEFLDFFTSRQREAGPGTWEWPVCVCVEIVRAEIRWQDSNRWNWKSVH